ncbi:PTS sugar transporter subunit IIA [Desulfovermiculus halophilus]|jgi:PTS system nitrogen regulatory IIA component|uniref:PTS sugar transporter subunit IIA n=1 Tax=Desulfovermiculus halophilus TaxID=339722 RepID=UPI000485201D|nr:PTS sugar transporter subunit IIA [Desulfovermiculus halophilus]
MKLSDYLAQDLIVPELKSTTKNEVLGELLDSFQTKWPDQDKNKAHTILMQREELGSTGIGDGVAIPHGKMDDLKDIVVIVGRSLKGVDFKSLDTKPCYIFFLVLAPEHVAGMHLRILAQISRLLKDPDFRESFLHAEGQKGLWTLLQSV